MAIDVNLIKPFLESTKSVLEQFGITNLKRGNIAKRVRLNSNYPVTIVVGIVGAIRGNITYNFPKDTAMKLAATMMMGMEVNELDEMAKSALAELGNMVTGNSSGQFEKMDKIIDISPPTLITGKNIIAWISSVETLTIEFECEAGKFEINIGLEM